MSDAAIYCRGRTYSEHCAWLDSLQPDSDEYRIVHMPPGYRFFLALIAYSKRVLLTMEMTAGERLRILNGMNECVGGPITDTVVAVIEPLCDDGAAIVAEICSLAVDDQSRAFEKGDVFRLLAKLNPSLLRALTLCV
jgi:hypothetical protein